MNIVLMLLKRWPLIIVAYAAFSTWYSYNAHQNVKQLRGQNSLLERKWEAADKTLTAHAATNTEIVAELASRIERVDSLPDDGCLDRNMPSDYVGMRD